MNLIEKEVLDLLNNTISKEYLESAKIELKENKGAYNSIVIEAQSTIYRNGYNTSVLFARIKTEGTVTYISFSDTNKPLIQKVFDYETIKSDESFLRVSIDDFLIKVKNDTQAQEVVNKIFISSFSFTPFGCCGRYKECSEAGKCIHPDIIYATACQYKKHLDDGNNFYKE